MGTSRIDHLKQDGRFPSHTILGGYTLVYDTSDCEVLCAVCVNDEAQHVEDDPQWEVIAVGVYWEGADMFCAHCNAAIESSYGDPDADE